MRNWQVRRWCAARLRDRERENIRTIHTIQAVESAQGMRENRRPVRGYGCKNKDICMNRPRIRAQYGDPQRARRDAVRGSLQRKLPSVTISTATLSGARLGRVFAKLHALNYPTLSVLTHSDRRGSVRALALRANAMICELGTGNMQGTRAKLVRLVQLHSASLQLCA